MTTRIFIENATSIQWILMNQDGKKEYVIASNTIYSLKLNDSKTYTLTNTNQNKITITIGINGDIKNIVTTCHNVLVSLKNAEHHTLYNLLAPHCQYYGYQPDPLIISPYRCHVAGHYQNKILITPATNPNARVIPPTIPSSLDHQETFAHSNCSILSFITR